MHSLESTKCKLLICYLSHFLSAFEDDSGVIMGHNQVRIQDLIGGGPRSGTMKFANVAKQSCASEASPIVAGGLGPAQGPQKLWGF